MFGSGILEVAIGVIFVFLLVSIICSAIREGIEAWLKTRAAYLEHGIRELLHDLGGGGLAALLHASADLRPVRGRVRARAKGARRSRSALRPAATCRRTSRRATSRWRCWTSRRAGRSPTAEQRPRRVR